MKLLLIDKKQKQWINPQYIIRTEPNGDKEITVRMVDGGAAVMSMETFYESVLEIPNIKNAEPIKPQTVEEAVAARKLQHQTK